MSGTLGSVSYWYIQVFSNCRKKNDETFLVAGFSCFLLFYFLVRKEADVVLDVRSNVLFSNIGH